MKNTKLANTLTKALLILLSALMLVTSVVYCFNPKTASAQPEIINGEAAETEILEEEEEYADPFADGKIYCDATLDDDFCDDSLIVVLDEKLSKLAGIANDIVSRFFSLINCRSIENLTEILDPSPSLLDYYKTHKFRQILHIKLGLNSKQYVLKAIKFLEKLDGILYVGPDYIEDVAATFDPGWGDLWGLHGAYGIDVEKAWNKTMGTKNVRVGVIDTGIANHADLNANLSEGWDFYNFDNTTNDDVRLHGTHIAGTIAAEVNNGIGIAGVAPNVTLVPLQVDGGNKKLDGSAILYAINYATNLWGTENQISILNYSVSGYGQSTEKLIAILQFPGLFVWAAGNDGENVDYFENISLFKLDNLISVGAIDKNGVRGVWNEIDDSGKSIIKSSNYGNNVDIFAPGIEIWSTIPSETYGKGSGTSMAAPHVTGVAALLLSMNPGLTASQIKTSIIAGSVPITISAPGYTQYTRRLSADKALEYANSHYDYVPAYLRFQLVGNNNGWQVKIINDNKFAVNVTYNYKMCFKDDAKNFTGLKHLSDVTIPAYGSRQVTIQENGTACYIVAAINYSLNGKNYRRISYVNELEKDGDNYSTNSVFHYQKQILLKYPDTYRVPDYLILTPTNRTWKWTYNWDIDIKNPNSFAVRVSYNSNMCFNGDAANFTVSDIVTITIPAGGTVNKRILGNGTACYITACIEYSYNGFDYRSITYANELSKNNNSYSLSSYRTRIHVL